MVGGFLVGVGRLGEVFLLVVVGEGDVFKVMRALVLDLLVCVLREGEEGGLSLGREDLEGGLGLDLGGFLRW